MHDTFDDDYCTSILTLQLWRKKNVRDGCNTDGYLDKLESIQEQLELCKKSLADFLDGRRRQFPRYYFVSEADLLDILSNGSDPNKILVHTPKVISHAIDDVLLLTYTPVVSPLKSVAVYCDFYGGVPPLGPGVPLLQDFDPGR